jgi:hypothetical protein
MGRRCEVADATKADSAGSYDVYFSQTPDAASATAGYTGGAGMDGWRNPYWKDASRETLDIYF